MLLQVASLNIKMKYHNNPVELVKTTIKLDVDMKNEKEQWLKRIGFQLGSKETKNLLACDGGSKAIPQF